MAAAVDEIITHLEPLVGLKLSIARRALDMRMFDFGPIQKFKDATIGEFALHIQCPWRVEGPHGIVTGSGDLWQSIEVDDKIDWDTWDYDKDGNLQDHQMRTLFNMDDPQTRSLVNESDQLVVEAVHADPYGGAEIVLSGGYRLILFPEGTRAEDWRIFQTGGNPHFVIAGGKIE